MLGTLLISGRDWLWPVLGLAAVALGALIWGYRHTPATRGIQASCVALKLTGLVALFACLLDPLWVGQRARPGSNYLAIVTDNSQGMQIRDANQARSRGESLRELLTASSSRWQEMLQENFQVRRYLFDTRLHHTASFADLDFSGRVSSLGSALRTVADRYRGQPLAGILLFTDGNATDLPDGLSGLPSLPPIYSVVIGKDSAVKDIALQKVVATQTAFEDAPVSIQAEVNSSGYLGQEIIAQLYECDNFPGGGAASSGRQPLEQVQKPHRDGEPLAFRFQLRPEKGGVQFYRLRVSARSELSQFEKPETASEATLANNSRIIAVDRGNGPYRVLYVSGRPNWEYKFLHRALDEDDQVQLSALIRLAKREPKLEFRGRAGESSNPLYRGFSNQSKEETEQYDQAVIRPLAPNEEEFERLRAGFPKTPEQLFRYHAVILDDVESEFFTRDQMMLLQRFVSQRGGGLLMLGGQESFREGKFEHTPIGELLPVYLSGPTQPGPGGGFHLNLTREGWLQPWARLRNNEADEKKRLEEVTPFSVLNRVRDLKPGASPIATVSDQSGQVYPALVVQRFGNGRTGALLIGDLWRWGLRDKDSHRDMDKAWRQLVRWFVADVPPRIHAQAEPLPGDPDQAILLQIRVRDEKFLPMDNAAVSLTVQPILDQSTTNTAPTNSPLPGKAASLIRLSAEPAVSEPGLYQATFVPRATGGYRAEAVVTNSVGAEIGRAAAGWSSDPAAEEFRSLTPNRPLLSELAKSTGGELIDLNQLEQFASRLPQRKAPIVENWSRPLWHLPAVFLFALVCFIGEWGLRRWKGLA